jgi:hypothetical protein
MDAGADATSECSPCGLGRTTFCLCQGRQKFSEGHKLTDSNLPYSAFIYGDRVELQRNHLVTYPHRQAWRTTHSRLSEARGYTVGQGHVNYRFELARAIEAIWNRFIMELSLVAL